MLVSDEEYLEKIPIKYLDYATGLARIVGIEVGDVSGQRNGQQVLSLPEARNLLVFDVVSHGEVGEQRLLGHVPNLARLVAGRAQQLSAVRTPGDGVDAPFVSRTADLADQFRRLAVVDEDSAVETSGGKVVAVRRIPDRLDKTSVFRFGALELERRS